MFFPGAQCNLVLVPRKLAWKITKRKEEEKVIDVDNVETKTLIQEAHTTIGRTMSLRKKARIQRMRQTRSLREEAHIAHTHKRKEEEKVISTLTMWKPKTL